MSSAITRRSRSDSGTSPETIRWARPFDDRRLADAGLADQHRVVLRAPRQDLDHAADLVVAADHRIELAVLGGLGQVAAELLERLDLVLGRLVGHAVRAADLGDRLQQRVARGAGAAQRVDRGAGASASSRCSVEMYSSLSSRISCSARAQHGSSAGDGRGLGGVLERRQRVERGVDLGAQRLDRDAELAQDGHDQPVGLLEQHREQVRRLDLRVAAVGGKSDRGLEGLLGLDREAVRLHSDLSVARLRSGSIVKPLSEDRASVLALHRNLERRAGVLGADDLPGCASARGRSPRAPARAPARAAAISLLQLGGAALERLDPALRALELRLELEHALDAREVEAGVVGHLLDPPQPLDVRTASTAACPSASACGSISPRASYMRSVCGCISASSAATEIMKTPRSAETSTVVVVCALVDQVDRLRLASAREQPRLAGCRS